ncbi:MAG: ABC transporter ATP-binding protein [Patescibacteria group bacterium]
MSIIKMKDIKKSYSEPVLKGINLNICKGEFVAIIGASGSGKSTILNIMGLLDIPTSGEYLFDGANIMKMTEDELANARNKKIGFIFQSFEKFILKKSSVLNNIILPLVYSDVPEHKWRQMAEDKLNAVGIKNKINNYMNQLSGGEAQRVAIARALINDPSVLLADEPTGNLDTKRSAEIMEIFLRLNRQGVSIVMITHEPHIAVYASRQIILKDGLVVGDEEDGL